MSLAILLAVVGCADAPQEPLVVGGRPVVARPDSYPRHQPHRAYLRQRPARPRPGQGTAWDRMLSLYGFPEADNGRVGRELAWYLAHPDYVARVQERAAPYLHLILDEIEAKGLPGELALLPAVESAFIPEAYSRAAASGLWQFIPSTGRMFGLEQNPWYDGRRDVYASTVAATDFLKDLAGSFNGDWFLALASYNYGKGNVNKAIMRNVYQGLPTDYWSLGLPKETADYVPRLLAIAKLFANADRYGIRLHDIPNRPYCEAVNVGSQLDLDKAAELAGVPLGHLLKLNPCYKKGSTAPQGPHRLLVPVSRVRAFRHNLAQLPYEDRVAQRRRDAELLAEKRRQNELLAEKAKEEAAERAEARLAKDAIGQQRYAYDPYRQPYGDRAAERRRGAELLAEKTRQNGLLAQKSEEEAAERAETRRARDAIAQQRYAYAPAPARHYRLGGGERPAAKRQAAKAPSGQVYVVKKGDTFFNVSKRLAVSRGDIAAWNGISPDSNLRLGQKLVIRAAGPQLASASPTRLVRYTVKPGDTLMRLSRKFGVTLDDLKKANPAASRGLRPGQNLKILIDNNGQET